MLIDRAFKADGNRPVCHEAQENLGAT